MTTAARDVRASTTVARSVRIRDPGSLVALLPETGPLAWLRRGDGLVAWGQTTRYDASGPDRFAFTDQWWRDLTSRALVRDDVNVPGSGLLAFGSLAYADDPGSSTLIVPEVVVGRRGDISWMTRVAAGGVPGVPTRPAPAPGPVRSPEALRFSDGAMSGTEWQTAVAEAVARIRAGRLNKVVLARDLIVELDAPLDVRAPLRKLSEGYPSCWTFDVDGLFGATPELLVRRERGLVTSRVLAGTIRRTGDDASDLALAASLARSSKDLEEHEFAVQSVAKALAPHCSSMNVPESPFVLHLPNVMHLATDVTGVLFGEISSLGLASALHPSAAVGGAPTAAALELIAELEGMNRDRYTGPVGWMDASGDGEWGIALRCGEYDGSRVRLFAGCGIVSDSDPEAELAEAAAKFMPMRDALAP